MKLTKYEHACMVIEKGDSALVIDPGGFTMPLTDLMDVVAVVITHEHGDHWTAEQLTRIKERNPKVRFFGPSGVAAAAPGFEIEVVAAGDTVTVEPFTLKFFGEKHAVIHESIPLVDNVGVLVNDELYYAGDSYTVPGVSVPVLAAPVGAPWLKIGEAMDYVLAVKPRQAFPVHEAVLSQIGRNLGNDRLRNATEQGGGEFVVLEAGESLEL
jgi:L-ascorbate metabolism protein UlaG (beta-lactamase superfamily)